jgi:uncharacterized protein (DUF1015 family)
MATIKPFKAIRPTKDKVANLVSNSYQSYSRRQLNAELSFNPFSFLHILNPGYKYSKTVKGQQRFQLVHSRYLEFLEENILLKDAKDSFYIYQVESKNVNCSGLFCATSVADYRNNIIKRHENTLQRREELFANYLNTVKFNAEPVLMTYENKDSIAELIKKEKEKDPEYFFTTADRITHKLWVIAEQPTLDALVAEFESLDNLYIADGHHRSASSNLLAQIREQENENQVGNEPYNYFMSYLIPDNEIQIYEFNRMVKDLNGLTKEEFLIQLDLYFRIENKGNMLYKPTKKHHFSMYLDGDFYSLYLRKKVYKFTDALSELDTQILFKTILQPILGIQDLRKDKRIGYGYGKHNIVKMKDLIDKGKYTVGFGLVPTTMNEIKSIADAGLVMPPKSTYIEPKLRSGLAIYEL